MNTEPEEVYPQSICPERFQFKHQGQVVGIPYCRSHPLDQYNESIRRVVIVLHGVLRNADDYYPNMMAAVNHAGVTETTLVIAPQFLLAEDIERFGLPDDILYWGEESGEGWKKGDESISTPDHPRKATVSSFEVVDRMVQQIANPDVFTNLRAVIVAGHSAGGQFVNRYAAGTQVEGFIPKGIYLRYIVANPSTYVYFTPKRRVEGETNVFETPKDPNPDYDDYKYGLKNLNPYMAAAGEDLIYQLYPGKDVVYLLGGEDTREAHLEQTPNAMLQGINRLARGQIYFHYLQHTFGEAITRNHKIAIVPCVGHDNAAIFKSDAGIRFLFDVSR